MCLQECVSHRVGVFPEPGSSGSTPNLQVISQLGLERLVPLMKPHSAISAAFRQSFPGPRQEKKPEAAACGSKSQAGSPMLGTGWCPSLSQKVLTVVQGAPWVHSS